MEYYRALKKTTHKNKDESQKCHAENKKPDADQCDSICIKVKKKQSQGSWNA